MAVRVCRTSIVLEPSSRNSATDIANESTQRLSIFADISHATRPSRHLRSALSKGHRRDVVIIVQPCFVGLASFSNQAAATMQQT